MCVEGIRVVKHVQRGGKGVSSHHTSEKQLAEGAPTNSVPAATEIRRIRAKDEMTGRTRGGRG